MTETLLTGAVILLGLAVAGTLYLVLHRTNPQPHLPLTTEACDLGMHDRCMKNWCLCSCHFSTPL